MSKRKKKQLSLLDLYPGNDPNQDYDDDWDDKPAKAAPAPADTQVVTLRDFMIPAKVDAFALSYEPCDEFAPGAECFDDSRLREYFKAYVCTIGDPLSLYIEELKLYNFSMVTSLATNIPCIFARRKF